MPRDGRSLNGVVRCRLRFSLRFALIATTIFCAVLAAWNAYVLPYQRQRAAVVVVQKAGGHVTSRPGGPKWMRDVFGEENFQDVVLVDLGGADFDPSLMDDLLRFRQLQTLVVSGKRFSDEELRRIASLPSLRNLLLDPQGGRSRNAAFPRCLRGFSMICWAVKHSCAIALFVEF